MVEILTEEEFVHFNFAFPTNKVAGEASVSGVEAVFQIVRQLLVPPSPEDPDGFVWEQDAMERALAGLAQQEEQEGSSLEGAAREALVKQMVGDDNRFHALDVDSLKALTLDDVRDALVALLQPDKTEISVSGDFDGAVIEELAARYLGSLPLLTSKPEPKGSPLTRFSPSQMAAKVAASAAQALLSTSNLLSSSQTAIAPSSVFDVPKVLVCSPFRLPTNGVEQHIEIVVPDSDPRAIAHVAGIAPNRWGILHDGKDFRESILKIFPLSSEDATVVDAYQDTRYGTFGGNISTRSSAGLSSLGQNARRAQPLWPAAVLALAQEILNRRLFSQVRERKGLTYDANFQLCAYDRLCGGWWIVTVTATPANARLALDACVETLEHIRPDPTMPLGAVYPVTQENLIAAQRVLIQKHTSELRSNK